MPSSEVLQQAQHFGEFYFQQIREATINSFKQEVAVYPDVQVRFVLDQAISVLKNHFSRPEAPRSYTPASLFASYFAHEYFQTRFSKEQIDQAVKFIAQNQAEVFTFAQIPVVVIGPPIIRYLSERGLIHAHGAAAYCPIENGFHFIQSRQGSSAFPLSSEKIQSITDRSYFRHELHHVLLAILRDEGHLIAPSDESNPEDREKYERLRDEMIAYIITGYNPAREPILHLTGTEDENDSFNQKAKPVVSLLNTVTSPQLSWYILPIMRSTNLKQLERRLRIFKRKWES